MRMDTELEGRNECGISGHWPVPETKRPMYKLEKNRCDCHPETCCCNPWAILKNGEKYVTIFEKLKAQTIVDALNAI